MGSSQGAWHQGPLNVLCHGDDDDDDDDDDVDDDDDDDDDDGEQGGPGSWH